MPPVQTDFFQLEGGLDLVTPAITMPSGRAIDALNYEPEISGGYRRIDGYERFDGRPSPTDGATYTAVKCTLTNAVAIGNTVTSDTSSISGTVIALDYQTAYTLVVLGGVDPSTQTIASGESLSISGVRIGYASEQSGRVVDPSADADYTLAAANLLRGNIGQVPGSGDIVGLFVLNDTVYAFRDSTDGTHQLLYKSTSSGWTLVPFAKEIKFDSGTSKIAVGDTVTNSDASVSATVAAVVWRAGAWGANAPQAAGYLVLNNLTGGNWTVGQGLYVAGFQRATAQSAATDITRAGGAPQMMDVTKYSFGERTGEQVVYGCDGLNLAFEFDGTTFVHIRTGRATDNPNHIAAHLNFLFLSYGTSIDKSTVGDPYNWDALQTAAEFTAGEDVTGMVPMIGGNQAPVMSIFMSNKVSVLYGSSSADFKLQDAMSDVGYSAGTMKSISGTVFGLTARGIQTMQNTQAFGDFEFGSVSSMVHPLINRLRGHERTAVVLKNKNQYRVYYADDSGSCVAVGLGANKINGIMPLEYGRPVKCITNETFSDGTEHTFFGSDDGYVYEDNKGTSFDGDDIEAWVRLPFSHQRSPRTRKRYRRAVLEADADSFCKVNVGYDFGYGNPDVAPPALSNDAAMVGGTGGYWDQFTWDEFIWDAQLIASPSITIDGTEKNISLLFYSKRAQDGSHTLQGVSLLYTIRRTER